MTGSKRDGGVKRFDRDVGGTGAIPIRVALGELSISALGIALYVAWNAQFLRPAADDYSWAVAADQGVLGGVWYWWSNWSGDLTAMLFNNLLVGLPVRHFSWAFASAFTFFIAAAIVTGLVWWIALEAHKHSSMPNRSVLVTMQLIPVAVISWWGYFWITPLLDPDALNAGLLAAGVTMWQTLNAHYVISVALLLLGWFFLETRHVTSLVGTGAGYLGIGLLIGLAGPVLALSWIVMVAVIAVASWLRKQTAVIKKAKVWLVAEVGIVLGALASHFSPGSQVRKPLLANPEINSDFALQLAVIGIPGGFRDWWSAITSPGAATVVVVFVGLSLLMVFQGWKPRIGYLLRVGLGLLGFSFILALVNRSSEFFAYASYHHLVTQQTVAWVALVTLAMSLGAWVAQLGRYTIAVPVTVLSTMAGIVLIGVSMVGMVNNIKDRYLQWEIGPAPITRAFTDIEDPDGWQRAAWMALRTLRDVPNRGISPS